MTIGTGILPFSVKIANLSAVTGVFNGDSLSFQSGINSSNAVVSMHAPDSIWPPTVDAFSITQTRNSSPYVMVNENVLEIPLL